MVEGVTSHSGMGALELSPSLPCMQLGSPAPLASPLLSMISPPHCLSLPRLSYRRSWSREGGGRHRLRWHFLRLPQRQAAGPRCLLFKDQRPHQCGKCSDGSGEETGMAEHCSTPACSLQSDCTRPRPFISLRCLGWEGSPIFQPHVEFQRPPSASQDCEKELEFLLLHPSLLLEKQRWKRSSVASSPSSGLSRKLYCTYCCCACW